MINLQNGDCLEKLKLLDDNSIDSIVTDPPYGLAFMGKKWDYDVPSVDIWKECLRVLKPGGHLLSFGGTRTYHRMVINIEDAGFEIRDQIMWIYGSGFPKSMDISKAIDKQAGAAREVVGMRESPYMSTARNDSESIGKHKVQIGKNGYELHPIPAPATDSAKQWQGWGTALKPANEPICLARKPISEKTVASNVLKYGTGAMNIDECRVGSEMIESGRAGRSVTDSIYKDGLAPQDEKQFAQGRWPANVIFDEEAGKILDEMSGAMKLGGSQRGSTIKKSNGGFGGWAGNIESPPLRVESDPYGASRFFYCAKTSKSERNAGLEDMEEKEITDKFTNGSNQINSKWIVDPRHKNGGYEASRSTHQRNHHPTVKPIKLMTYLIKLITPPNGIVLDPFMGSGSTGVAAREFGFKFVGIERDESYFEIASKRISK